MDSEKDSQSVPARPNNGAEPDDGPAAYAMQVDRSADNTAASSIGAHVGADLPPKALAKDDQGSKFNGNGDASAAKASEDGGVDADDPLSLAEIIDAAIARACGEEPPKRLPRHLRLALAAGGAGVRVRSSQVSPDGSDEKEHTKVRVGSHDEPSLAAADQTAAVSVAPVVVQAQAPLDPRLAELYRIIEAAFAKLEALA